jgi:hypothetical protein
MAPVKIENRSKGGRRGGSQAGRSVYLLGVRSHSSYQACIVALLQPVLDVSFVHHS